MIKATIKLIQTIFAISLIANLTIVPIRKKKQLLFPKQ